MNSIIDLISSEADYQTSKNVCYAVFACDTISDLPQKEYSASITLAQGSKAIVISTGKKYMMQSDGTWSEQPSEHINSGDYYDKTAVDGMINNIESELPDKETYSYGTFLEGNIDLNDITDLGTYNTTAANAATMNNAPKSPNGAITGFRMDVEQLSETLVTQIVRTNGAECYIFVRNQTTNGFTPWYNINEWGLARGIASGSDLNNYMTPGAYYCGGATSSTLSNNPETGSAIKLEVEYLNNTNRLIQTLTPATNGAFKFYKRQYTSSGWQSWYLFQGTAVTTTNSANSLQLNNLNGINGRMDLNDDE